MPKKPMLLLDKIQKKYGSVTAVAPMDLEIQKGEFCTLLGPSGCGKTTLLRLIAGLESQSSGSIWIDDQDVSHWPAFRRPIGLVFQGYALFPHLNVFENIAYGLKVLKRSSEDVRSETNQIAAVLGIQDFLERGVHQLSGGQQQRVALARALIMKPKILLFDEPLSNLDARLRRSVREEIKQIHQQFKMTSIYVTHDQSEALTLADRIALMQDGKIVQMGTPQELYEEPKDLFTATFLGEANWIETEEGRNLVRPERIEISRNGGPHKGRLVKKAYLGWCYEYTVRCNFGEVFVVDTAMKEHFEIGEEVFLRFHRVQLLK